MQRELLALNAVARCMDYIRERSCPGREGLLVMVLANLTAAEAGAEALLQVLPLPLVPRGCPKCSALLVCPGRHSRAPAAFAFAPAAFERRSCGCRWCRWGGARWKASTCLC